MEVRRLQQQRAIWANRIQVMACRIAIPIAEPSQAAAREAPSLEASLTDSPPDTIGRVSTNLAPPSSESSTVSSPPCSRASFLQSQRPSPVPTPDSFVVKKAGKARYELQHGSASRG